jgi:hypothetical protein
LVGGGELETFDEKSSTVFVLDGDGITIDFGVPEVRHGDFEFALTEIFRVVKNHIVVERGGYSEKVGAKCFPVAFDDFEPERFEDHSLGFVVVGLAHGDYYTDFREKVKRVFILFLRI